MLWNLRDRMSFSVLDLWQYYALNETCISFCPELANNQTLEMIAVDIDFTSKGLD